MAGKTQPAVRGKVCGFIKHDDYMTPKYAWENIKQFIPKDKVIWEAFYGDGVSAEYLRELGCKEVIHEDIDFFENDLGEVIISNPPFSLAKKIMPRLKELDKPFILITPSITLLSKWYQLLFKEHTQAIIPLKRPTFTHLKSKKKGYSPPFGTCYMCYKMNLQKDLIFLE